jgi:P-type Mg2+ transporter
MTTSAASKTNEIKVNKNSAWKVFIRQFKNPLLLIFIISTIVAFLLGQKTEAFVIWFVMALSIVLGFWNEFQAETIVHDLIKKISFTTTIIKNGIKEQIPVRDVMLGDTVVLLPGSIIPADLKLTLSEDLEVNESILTGESLPIRKKEGDSLFMGTIVTGGTAEGVVTAIGMDTKFGEISNSVSKNRPLTEFQKGLKDFSTLLAKIAGVTVFIVIILGYFLGHPVIETILFALTVAMGITPELLPLIVTISLSYGAKKLAKENLIVKQFVSIEDLGNMEILCTDKTGTLTEGNIALSVYQNIQGEKDNTTLQMGLICNSAFTHKHVFGDSIDKAIWEYANKVGIKIEGKVKKLFEVPFNYENRFMSVVVESKDQEIVICKGSYEAIIARCDLTPAQQSELEKTIRDMHNKGLRVVAVASKEIKNWNPKLVKTEFKDLKFVGFIGFTDVPKKDLAEVFTKFKNLGVRVKILTGDSEVVAEKICKDVNFVYNKVLTGPQIEQLTEEELASKVWTTDIFARITPSQKIRIVQALKKGGHTVGFLGDGVNDSPALRMADVGISVNTAVDVAKDAASVVLLHKSLGVIADGVHQGRITFNNTIKYILMGSSSSFGNMVSAAGASIVLPFLPMTPVQFLLNDILYDVSQLSIPTDNVDADQILQPKNWDINYIKRFMIIFGLIGTVYDFLTFGVMYFVFRARGPLFQTGWFVTSFITEVLVVFVIRTKRSPFWKSKPSLPFLATCLAVVLIGLYLPFSPLATYFGFLPLPKLYFGFLLGITLTYLVFVEIGKHFLNRNN